MKKYANQDIAVRQPGGRPMMAISKGRAFDPDDPIVASYPWLFVEDGDDAPERATSAPGEKRAATRRKATDTSKA